MLCFGLSHAVRSLGCLLFEVLNASFRPGPLCAPFSRAAGRRMAWRGLARRAAGMRAGIKAHDKVEGAVGLQRCDEIHHERVLREFGLR